MTEDQKDAINAIEKINEKLYAKYDKNDDLDNLPIVNITIADMYFFIAISIPDEFHGQEVKIFNSENNDRIFYEKSNTYETFYKLIKRKFLETKEEIYCVKW